MSERIRKVNELIKRELSQIILEEMNFPENVLVTIIKVEAAPNLYSARVYINVISTSHRARSGAGPEKEAKEAFIMLKNNIYNLQQLLNKRLRMRPIPRIEFLQEKQVQKTEKIEEILDKIKVEKQN
ncbi:ribosome-binding factor A [Candidatus Parcubacteria bacterium]|nr:ribosome-binding factor A [Candidatus Parcubacteria bacterium]